MAITQINYGAAPDDGTGDPLRSAWIKTDDNFQDLDERKANSADVATALGLKVDAVAGKGLSTEDFTTLEKDKLDGVQDNATYNRPDSETDDALDLKADKTAVASAIAMAQTFTTVPATFQAPVVIVTTPHYRLMQWNGTKYVRSPLGPMPGVYFYAHDPLGKIAHGIQVRTDVTYNTADHPDLAEYLGVTAATFVLPGDGRARVLRGSDLGVGVDITLVDGFAQGDAGRNLTGSMSRTYYAGTDLTSGAFAKQGTAAQPVGGVSTVNTYGYDLDASRQWPTANEFRVKSLVARLYMTR